MTQINVFIFNDALTSEVSHLNGKGILDLKVIIRLKIYLFIVFLVKWNPTAFN